MMRKKREDHILLEMKIGKAIRTITRYFQKLMCFDYAKTITSYFIIQDGFTSSLEVSLLKRESEIIIHQMKNTQQHKMSFTCKLELII